MRIFKRKSRSQRVIKTVENSIAKRVHLHLPGRPPDKAVKVGLIAAGGLTGLTAGSAGISSLRRRNEEAEGDS
jgi:hypothetical protein